MLLTLSTTHDPATDLGFLLHKNPARPLQTKELSFGPAHVFYPEASDERCTAALMLEIDPIALARGKGGAAQASPSFALGQYVNDRPYAASSFLSVALAQVYGSALGGRCKDRPELVDTPIPLVATVHGLPARGGGESLLRNLFEPLGYEVTTRRLPFDDPSGEGGPYHELTLMATIRLSELLGHLYVLVPALNDQKHYFVDLPEVEKLLRHGQGWLAKHPLREEVARRYLRRRSSLVRRAVEALTIDEESPPSHDPAEVEGERPIRLNQQRMEAVEVALEEVAAASVLDLGCGEGNLIRRLMSVKRYARIVGVDASSRALEIAERKLNLDRLPPSQSGRVRLVQGALTYRDRRLESGGELAGDDPFDAACLVEVIEHLDPSRLASLGRAVLGKIRPRRLIVTTPNREYNATWPSLPAGRFRHRDHRFEWSRDEFEAWANALASEHGYGVAFRPIGPVDEQIGPPTQMGVFDVRA